MSTVELSQFGSGPLRVPAGTAELPRPPVVSRAADTAIRASTAAVVLAVAGIAAYISYWHAYASYWHAYAVVCQYGESGVTAMLEPGTIDGLVYASSMVILHAARHQSPVPRLARAMLGLGIAASLAVNVAQGWSHGLVGAAAAAWPAVALVGSYELLAWMIRTAGPTGPDHGPGPDHGVPQADQPGTTRDPAAFPSCEAAVTAATRDNADPEPESVNDWFPTARVAVPVRGPGPGEPACIGQADHGGGPGRESTGSREPGGLTVPRSATVTAPVGDINAAAVAAYRASIREGTPLSERKLAASFGKTSRRWARSRMAEARQEPVVG